MSLRGRSPGFVKNREGWPDDPDHEDIRAFIVEFARSPYGQQTLEEIEQFGLPGVDSAADLTGLQSRFLRLARRERNRKQKQHGPN